MLQIGCIEPQYTIAFLLAPEIIVIIVGVVIILPQIAYYLYPYSENKESYDKSKEIFIISLLSDGELLIMMSVMVSLVVLAFVYEYVNPYDKRTYSKEVTDNKEPTDDL